MWACDPTHGSGGAPSAAGPLGLVSSITAGQSSRSTMSAGDPSRSRNERAGQGAKSTISIIAPSPYDPYRGLVYISHVEDPHIYKYISIRVIVRYDGYDGYCTLTCGFGGCTTGGSPWD